MLEARSLGGVAALIVSVSIAACGGSGAGSGFDDGSGGTTAADSDAGTFTSGDAHFGGDPAATLDAACATAKAQATRLPADLVFMFDRSDSMGDASKWTSCKSGLTSFFADPKSQGLSASLSYFCGDACTPSTYQTPSVPMSDLPQATTFAASMNAQILCKGTPTAPALQAAIAYAVDAKQHAPSGTAVVALVTDGEPTRCGGIANVSAVAQSGVANGIKTYVIGVGASLSNLDAIAAAGGTNSAILVSTANPSQLAHDFEAAVDQIRGQTVSCDFALPAPPNGRQLDPNATNVVVTSGGNESIVPYDAACAGPAGWHYDDASHPTKVVLCAPSCDAVRNDVAASVEVIFGCKTVGGAPR